MTSPVGFEPNKKRLLPREAVDKMSTFFFPHLRCHPEKLYSGQHSSTSHTRSITIFIFLTRYQNLFHESSFSSSQISSLPLMFKWWAVTERRNHYILARTLDKTKFVYVFVLGEAAYGQLVLIFFFHVKKILSGFI